MLFTYPHRLCRTLIISCLILTFICLAAPLTTHAQDLDEATFQGRVTDPNGAPVPGATVTARLTTTGAERTATTGDDGRYRLIELKPGTYQVRVAATGFADTVQTFEDLISGQTVRNDVELTIGIADNVEVSTEPPPVDTTRTVVGGTITTEELESLPNISRQALDLVFTLPGVTEQPFSLMDVAEDRNSNLNNINSETNPGSIEGGTFALSGGPAYSNNITIDGLDNNDDRVASERFQPSIEAIAEVQIITSQFAAEYGRASGGRVNIRTRAGTNRFRGRGFYFFRDEALNANTYRNNLRGFTRVPLQQHNPGFNFSGPLYLPRFGEGGEPFYSGRDRTFFFANYENDTVNAVQRIDTLVPVGVSSIIPLPVPTSLVRVRPERIVDLTPGVTPAQIAAFTDEFATPNTNQRISGRIDHRFTDKHNIFGSVQIGRTNNRRQFGGNNRLEDALLATLRNSAAIAITDNYVFSSNIVNQLRAQVSRLEPAIIAQRDENVVLISVRDSLPTTDPDFRGTTTGGPFTLITNNSSSNFANNRREERLQVQDSLSIVRGKHTIKLGGDIQYINSEIADLADATGTFNFNSVADFLANRPNRFRQNFGGNSSISNTYTAIFAQDEYQIRPNLTFSYGLRFENETVLRDRNNFGPRLGLAYDPFGTGKTVIRAGGGIFYNRPILRTIDDATITESRIAYDTDSVLVNQTRDANGNIIPGTGVRLATRPLVERQNYILNNIGFPGNLTVDNPIVPLGIRTITGGVGRIEPRRLDPTIRIPESYQANVGFERDIGGRFVVETNYTFNRGLHLLREFNANAPQIPAEFPDYAAFLLSREFSNTPPAGSTTRPINGATGDAVRFAVAPAGVNSNAIVNPTAGQPSVSTIYLNATSTSSNALPRLAALTVLDRFAPIPQADAIEQVASIGNSRYHGLTIELRRRFTRIGESGLGFSARGGYTLSSLKDDGIVNTSNATFPGDFASEFSRSRLDRRHRFVFSGAFDTPRYLGGIRFSPILRLASGAPFNIGSGIDRNLDSTTTDRPNFSGDLASLRSREPGEPLPANVLPQFSLPLIGQVGNLPRNAGIGPALFVFDITAQRDFRISERVRIRPFIEAGNVLNKTVFTFANEFIDFEAQNTNQPAFLSGFLVPSRTLRQRQIRVGLRFDF